MDNDPKHTTSSVKHGEGSVMAWACMASSGTGSLVFIDDVTEDRSSKINSAVFIAGVSKPSIAIDRLTVGS